MDNYRDEQKIMLKRFWQLFSTMGSMRKPNIPGRLELLIKTEKVARICYRRLKKGQGLEEKRSEFNKIKDTFTMHLLSDFCMVCYKSPTIKHHIFPLSFGGLNIKKNIIAICRECHSKIHPWLKQKC